MTVILLKQIFMMFLLAGVGYFLFLSGKITLEGSRALGNILVYISLPCVIINSFLTELTPERLRGMLISCAASAAVLLLSVLMSRAVFKKDGIATFAGAFSNAGFFGVPLIAASVNEEAVFYIATFIAFLNILQWTYGIYLLTGKKGEVGVRKLITAPFFVAIAAGMICFGGQLQLPEVLTKAIGYLAGMNTPLAMFAVGIYLAQAKGENLLKDKNLYVISFVRLLVIPIVVAVLFCLIPESYRDLKLSVLIAAACPVGANIAVYAQLHGQDYAYAVKTVVVSTMASLLTLPVVVPVAEYLWSLA